MATLHYQSPLGTLANLQAMATANGLIPRKLYGVQDGASYAIAQALTASTYAIVGRGAVLPDPALVAAIRAGSGTGFLSPPEAWEAMAPVALTDAATIALDLGSGVGSFTVTLGGNRTLGNPTNAKPGQKFNITASRAAGETLSFGSAYVAMGPIALPASGKRFKVVGEVMSASEVHIAIVGEP